MKIGICQLDICWEDKNKNRGKVKHFIMEAAAAGVDLLLFPEMTLTGFSMNISITADYQEESLNFFLGEAMNNLINIGFGWVEALGEKARNHYSIVSSDGAVLSDYVKIHPFSFAREDEYFVPGSHVTCFEMCGAGISTFICYDLRFPEVFQAVSDQTALIIVAANWPDPRKEHWITLLKARAIENQVYIAGINCVGGKGGLNYSGNSALIDPQGLVIDELKNVEGLLIADVILDNVISYRAQFPLKADRKVELYKSWL